MKVNAADIWTESNRICIDVRTPAEFQKGHIPFAKNLPLFSDEERVVVGTIYKQSNPEAAFEKGLEFVGPKMSSFVKKTKSMANGKKILLHCWRGGKRSRSMAWLLRMAGHDVSILEGGYKAYRNFVLQQFEQQGLKILILGGKTGCGKTDLLQLIKEQGEQVIDLEGLAHHKGSAFGALGESEQPTTEQFENNLYEVFRKLDPDKIIWIENENKTIGKIYIPDPFWKFMKSAPLINLERSTEKRIEIIRSLYGDFPTAQLKASFVKIKKRLGGQNLNAALEALDKNDLTNAIKIGLFYYDKAYKYYLDKNEAPFIHHLKSQNETNESISKQLIHLSKNHPELIAAYAAIPSSI